MRRDPADLGPLGSPISSQVGRRLGPTRFVCYVNDLAPPPSSLTLTASKQQARNSKLPTW